MNEQSLVLFDLDEDGVATLTLNRPERNNAWNPEIENAYRQRLEQVDRDPRVRAVIVTGAGRSFCPGVDTGRLEGLVGRELDLDGRMSPTTPLGVRKPMIAAINGACAGMGLVNALMCDIRFLARGARISTAFARRGLAAEYGISYLLPRLIGVENALDLLMSGRTIEADEARELGVVSRVTTPEDLLPAARAYARELAQKSSPIGMALAKHQVWTGLEQALTDSMRATYRAMSAATAGPDFHEGLQSYLDKREPSFPGLTADFQPAAITGADIETAFATLSRSGMEEAAD